MIHIEAVFDTEFPVEAMLQFESVPDLVRYLNLCFFLDVSELAEIGSS